VTTHPDRVSSTPAATASCSGQPLGHLLGARRQQRSARLGQRPGGPRPADIRERDLERGPGRDPQVGDLRKAGGNAIAGCVHAGDEDGDPAPVVRRMFAKRPRLARHDRLDPHRVPAAEPAQPPPLAVGDLGDDEAEPGAFTQGAGRAVGAVEGGEGRVLVGRRVERGGQVVDAHEPLLASGPAAPVVAAAALGDVLELGAGQAPAVGEGRGQVGAVEVGGLGAHRRTIGASVTHQPPG